MAEFEDDYSEIEVAIARERYVNRGMLGGFDIDSDNDSNTDSYTDDSAEDLAEEFSLELSSVNVTVIKGDIADQTTDVIVNMTSSNLDLQQGVASRALVAKGGTSIQEDVNTKYSNGIKEGEIAISDSGNLSCTEVYHITMTRRKRSGHEMVRKYVTKILEEATKAGHTSVAFPAIGTGKLGYDKHKVASAMFESVRSFSAKQPGSSVSTINFVIFPQDTDTLEAFKANEQQKSIDTSDRTVTTNQAGKITLELAIGDLKNQQTDVIVVTATRGLKLEKGRLSASVLEAAGPSLQTECDTKYPKGIQYEEVAKLGPGNTECKHIYLGAVPRLDRRQEGSRSHQEILVSFVTECLNEGSRDGVTSISFPTIGTGNLRYPPGMSAHFMVDAFNTFVKNNPSSTLTLIRIVIHADPSSISANLKPFEMEFNKGRSISSSTLYARPARNTPEFCRHMYRAPVTPPSYWTKYTNDKCVKDWNVCLKDGQPYTLVDVDEDTFFAVKRLVNQTWEPGKLKQGRDARGLVDIQFTRLQVTKVQRLENLTLLEQYGNKRQELFRYASEDPLDKLSDVTGISKGQPKTEIHLDETWRNRLFSEVNEMYLFHGTKNVNIQSVCTHGLDTKIGQDKAVYGQAVYMAESSTKSDQYTDCKGNRQTAGLQMFLLRACLGKICMMKDCKKLPRPPCQESSCDGMTCDHKRYHSIVSEGKFIFREFIVYDGTQVYPEYLITYDRA